MTQDYLNQLFENYTGVEKFYWTADGTAFKSIDDANKHAVRLDNKAVRSVSHGGKLEDATIVAEGLEQDVESDASAGDVNNAGAAGAADVQLSKMKITQLRKLCEIRGISFDKDLTKDQLVDLLNAKAVEDATREVALDYNQMSVENLIKLCQERGIRLSGDEDAAELITLLTDWDAAEPQAQ